LDDETPKPPSKSHVYQQPIVSEAPSGKTTQLHRYFTKIRPDGTYTYHVISTTIEEPGKKPQVTHVVEVKKTDSSGRVTTKVLQHGDEYKWHAGKSKWSGSSAKAPTATAPITATAPVATSTSMPEPLGMTLSPGMGFGRPQPGWGTIGVHARPPLPDHYYTQLESLRGFAVTGKPPMRTTDEFRTSTWKSLCKDSTTNMLYGAWYMT
jgi:hypothetical protein